MSDGILRKITEVYAVNFTDILVPLGTFLEIPRSTLGIIFENSGEIFK